MKLNPPTPREPDKEKDDPGELPQGDTPQARWGQLCLTLVSVVVASLALHDSRRLRVELEERDRRETSLAAKSAPSVVAVGIRWTEDSGVHGIVWHGTGFALAGTAKFATAGHVVMSLQEGVVDLERRGLKPVPVAGTTDGRTLRLLEMQVHPTLIGKLSQDSEPGVVDVGCFRVEGDWRPVGLSCQEVRHRRPLLVGTTVAAIGFPTAVPTLTYPDTEGTPMIPTTKFGAIERLTALNGHPSRATVQHNLPLCGGFSGAPILTLSGEVVAIATRSTHLHINLPGTPKATTTPIAQWDRSRILDPAQINFGADIALLQDWLKADSQSTPARTVKPD